MLLYVLRPSGDDGDVLLIKRQKTSLLIRKLRDEQTERTFPTFTLSDPTRIWPGINQKETSKPDKTDPNIFLFLERDGKKTMSSVHYLYNRGGLGGYEKKRATKICFSACLPFFSINPRLWYLFVIDLVSFKWLHKARKIYGSGASPFGKSGNVTDFFADIIFKTLRMGTLYFLIFATYQVHRILFSINHFTYFDLVKQAERHNKLFMVSLHVQHLGIFLLSQCDWSNSKVKIVPDLQVVIKWKVHYLWWSKVKDYNLAIYITSLEN